MAKVKPYRNPIKIREAYPLSRKNKDKHIELLCPFCNPPHVILPGKPSACGTEIQVKAVQRMITQRTARAEGIKCLKCHKDVGGNMVRCQNGFIHVEECAPGVVVLASEPKYSRLAEKVFRLPDTLRKVIEKKMGVVKEIKEIDENGEETGKTLGYFFYKDSV